MSASRQPQIAPASSSTGSQQLVAAHQKESHAQQHLQNTADRVALAAARDAEVLDIIWQEDDRSPRFHVYVIVDDELEVLGLELIELDGRAPTAQQRQFYESQFESRLDAYDEFYESVAAAAWELRI